MSVSHVIPSIPPKCAMTREPEDKHCVLQSTQYNNICDTVPLDKLKYDSTNKLALPYITWGLIWDSKNRKEGIPEFFMNLISICKFNFLVRYKWKYQSKKREKIQFNHLG